MKKTKLTRSLLAACSIVALSAVMYGCAHDSGDDDELRMSLEQAEADAKTAEDAKTAADAAAAKLQKDVDDAEAEVKRIQDLLDAATGDTPGGTTDLQDQLDAAIVERDRLQGELDEATAPTVDPNPAVTAAAATKRTAITMTEVGETGTDEVGLGGADAPDAGATGAYTLAIEHGSTTITVQGDPTPDDDEMFEDAMAGLDRGRTMLVRETDPDMMTGDIEREIAIVATDIDPPVATAFAMVDGQELTVRQDDVGVDVANPADSLAVQTVNFAQVMSSAFSSSGAGSLTYLNDDDTTDDTDEAFEADGTYNGASGTYRCAGTGVCSVTYDAMGMIAGIGTDWIFTPDEDVTSDVPDAEYLYYGFWLQQTEDEDGVLTYNEVETFYGASGDLAPSDENVLDDVDGSASYTGEAVGVYVRDVNSVGGGTLVASTSGHFAADVALTANFTGDTIPVNIHNTVTGSISNFVLQHGEDNDWAVNLKGTRTTSESTFSGTANGGGAQARSKASSTAWSRETLPIRMITSRSSPRMRPASSTPASATARSPAPSGRMRTTSRASQQVPVPSVMET